MSGEGVSVIIIVRDGERYLREAIESVLAQELAPSEVIVVDDGSTDGSLAVAERFGEQLRCISIDQRGIAGARNVGITMSRGDWVAFLDADDLWAPGSLQALSTAFAMDPGLDVAFGHVRQFLSPELDATASARLTLRAGLDPGYLVGACMIRRAALDRVGPFLEEFATGDFIDWVARGRDLGLRERLLPNHVLSRRLHGLNHGLLVDGREDYARVLKRTLDRRRAASAGEQVVEGERSAGGEQRKDDEEVAVVDLDGGDRARGDGEG